MRKRLKQLVMFVGDGGALLLALWIMLLVRFQVTDAELWRQHFEAFFVPFIMWLAVFYIAGFYELAAIPSKLAMLWNLGKILLIDALLAASFFYIAPEFSADIVTPKTNIIILLVIFGALDFGWRAFFLFALQFRGLRQNIAFIGHNEKLREIMERISANPTLGYNLSLAIGAAPIAVSEINIEAIPGVPDATTLANLLSQRNINTVVIAQDSDIDEQLTQALYQCLPLEMSFVNFTNFYEGLTGKIPVNLIKKIWFLGNLREADKKYFEAVKNVFDWIIATIVGAVFLVTFPFLALAVKINSRGPIFYRQTRVGKNGKPFQLIKYRNMYHDKALNPDADSSSPTWCHGENDSRVTSVGRILRQTHIDELPQVINIFRGEMSVVGPRPERPEFVAQLEKTILYYRMRHLVKPGMTGWAQVKYRYGSTTEDALEKLQYELYYLKHRSVLIYLNILCRTLKQIIRSR